MTKPKSRTISAPFDARHVGGVNILGEGIPIVDMGRSSTTLEPDTAPSHTFAAPGNIEIPRRSNMITTLSEPRLKLKTSFSLLRGRSSSHSPNRIEAKHKWTETLEQSPQDEMPVHSLRKKPSTSKFWQRPHPESPIVESPQEDQEILEVDSTALPKTNSSGANKKPILSLFPSVRTANPYTYQSLPPPPPPLRPPPPTLPTAPKARPLLFLHTPSQKKLHIVRPKRADSGTAIDFDDVPADERPVGFREIVAVSSFEERMALYKKSRDYWAHADHGLDEWVDKAGTRGR